MDVVGTFWSLLPAIVAIGLALITKEVYSSLFLGIVLGGVLSVGYSFSALSTRLITDGFIASVTDAYNMGILIFLIILGTLVALMNRAGGSAAFGAWASRHVKTRVGAHLATVALGMLIFIDDYFNCLTVGSVMRPLTDRHKISREKLAYLIDSTAAPVCIIAPISSWAAAVSGFVGEGENGLTLFVKAIPYNYYALLTLVVIIGLAFVKADLKPMAAFELAAEQIQRSEEADEVRGKGTVFDLVFPIVSLIAFCVFGMIYSGGFFTADGDAYHNFVEAFANSDASVGLVIGSALALLATLVAYIARRVLPFRDCMGCLPDGFKAMVPAILILTMAWTLKGMTDGLGAKDYVAGLVSGTAGSLQSFLPAIIFVIAALLAFATGTSWGTFGILIPICIAVFPDVGSPLRVLSISACMAGAVCGDHCSPISDTTIMASAGAQCDHVNHVSTQLPYAISVAAISFLTYVFAGFVHNAVVSLLFGLVLAAGLLVVVKKVGAKR